MEECHHGERPRKALGLCETCYHRHLRHSDPKYLEYRKTSKRNWKLRNPEKHNAGNRRRARKRREKIGSHAYNVTRKRKISYEEYQALVEKQAGLCAICGQQTTLVVDHCHNSDQVRGLLCQTCNFGLGNFSDDVLKMARAIEYLKSSQFCEKQ
jgi:5-methylcytosine-specific restriction endonuclease McrA